MGRGMRIHFNIKRIAGVGAHTVLGVLVALAALPVAAEDDSAPVYARVGLWQVDRAQWGDFVEFFEKYEQATLEKLLADGVISEWGIDAFSLHEPDGYTHTTWIAADSYANVEGAMEALEDAFEQLGEAEQNQADAAFAGMITKHRDVFLRTEHQRSTDATLDGGYYRSFTVRVKRGHDDDFHSYWKNRLAPIYAKLLEEGTVVAYGLTVEEITTEKPGYHESWVVVPDAAALDKLDAAFAAWWGEMDEEGQRAVRTSIMDVVEPDTYRETMTNLIHYAIKGQ